MEIGADEQDSTWPTWLEVCGRRLDVRYVVREPSSGEMHGSGLTSHVWQAMTELDGAQVIAGGTTALEAVRGLAEEIVRRIGSPDTRFSTELPISRLKMERAVRHHWNR